MRKWITTMCALLALPTVSAAQDIHLPPRIEPGFASGEVLMQITPGGESFLRPGWAISIEGGALLMQDTVGAGQSERFEFGELSVGELADRLRAKYGARANEVSVLQVSRLLGAPSTRKGAAGDRHRWHRNVDPRDPVGYEVRGRRCDPGAGRKPHLSHDGMDHDRPPARTRHRLPIQESIMTELDTVVLRRNLPEEGLEKGDVGAIVHRHSEDAFEVEFVTGDGGTVAVVTVRANDIRSIDAGEILHVRSVRG